jgi:ketosteroid isomerase-like protein
MIERTGGAMTRTSLTGAHTIIYSTNPEADRAFLREHLGLPHVDVGHGWLIFGLPPGEMAVHPADENGRHELYLLCDDIETFAAAMTGRGIVCSPVAERGWGRLVNVTLPGGGSLSVYQPRHARPPAPAGTNLERAKAYLSALERGATGDALARFYAPEVVQEELPNRLVPEGVTRDLAALLDGAARGQNVMRQQRFELLRAYEAGDTVVMEVAWQGTAAVAVGSLPAGGEMRARFALFLEYRDGRIVRQRNYDCFDPW